MKRKIKKYKGGGMDAGNKANQAKSAAMGNVGAKGNPLSAGNQGAKNFVTTGSGNQNNQTQKVSVPFSAQKLLKVTSLLTPMGIGKAVLNQTTKMNRTRRAKGNMLIGGKKLPATRDFYRTTGTPLDVMSKEGKQYQKDAGLISTPKPMVPDGEQKQICPDGTFPPCVTAGKINPNVVKPKKFFNFKAYTSGGVSSGPPPKRGPNPQVPPVKFSRGGGAAIRGTKFKGVF